jgi:c-di-GMP-related signal transduction protein
LRCSPPWWPSRSLWCGSTSRSTPGTRIRKNAIQDKKLDQFYRLLGKFTLLAFLFIGADRSAEAVCDAILRLGQSLGTKVIAEGVENENQLAFLRRRRCDEAQGYLFGKPLVASEFERSWIATLAAA